MGNEILVFFHNKKSDTQILLSEAEKRFGMLQKCGMGEKEIFDHTCELISNNETISGALDLGSQWWSLDDFLKKQDETISKTCFNEPNPTPFPIQTTYGTCSFIGGTRLDELAIAITNIGTLPEEERLSIGLPLEQCRYFFEKASTDKDTVIWGLT